MKILIIGKGGREHALAKKCARSPLVDEVFVAPGNPGMSDCATLINIDECDIEGLLAFAKKENISLTIPGSEACLACGVVDAFKKEKRKIFGPTKNAAQLETSKQFAKDIMKKYRIKSAGYETFSTKQAAMAYLQTKTFPMVIKEDGLKAGKGVSIVSSLEEATVILEGCFSVDNKVVIEEFLTGIEYSLIALVHEGAIVRMQPVQDHKRAYDYDQGPNTGGMGVYSPVPQISNEVCLKSEIEVLRPIVDALEKEGIPYSGFLYAGLMLCEDGIQVIEFNVRMGDPEAQVLCQSLVNDLVLVIYELLERKTVKLHFHQSYYVGVVLAGKKYPECSSINAPITMKDLSSELYFMGVKKQEDLLLSNGGRVLIVVGEGETLKEAIKNTYEDVKKIVCDDLYYRKDIGQKGIQFMK